MISKQKLLRYLTGAVILFAIVFLAYFISETGDAYRALSIPGKVGFALFLAAFAWLIVRSFRLSNIEHAAEKERARYYIFRVEKHPSYSRLFVNDFIELYEMDEDFFWQTVAVPAINDAMDEYRKSHPEDNL